MVGNEIRVPVGEVVCLRITIEGHGMVETRRGVSS